MIDDCMRLTVDVLPLLREILTQKLINFKDEVIIMLIFSVCNYVQLGFIFAHVAGKGR